jgi:hypothetical protein
MSGLMWPKSGDKVDALWMDEADDGRMHFYPATVWGSVKKGGGPGSDVPDTRLVMWDNTSDFNKAGYKVAQWSQESWTTAIRPRKPFVLGNTYAPSDVPRSSDPFTTNFLKLRIPRVVPYHLYPKRDGGEQKRPAESGDDAPAPRVVPKYFSDGTEIPPMPVKYFKNGKELPPRKRVFQMDDEENVVKKVAKSDGGMAAKKVVKSDGFEMAAKNRFRRMAKASPVGGTPLQIGDKIQAVTNDFYPNDGDGWRHFFPATVLKISATEKWGLQVNVGWDKEGCGMGEESWVDFDEV